MNDSSFFDQRRHERSSFAYPVEIKILHQGDEMVTFSGYMENISVSGAGIYFEDRYGRVNIRELHESKVKISITMPNGEKIVLISNPRWIRKDVPQRLYIQAGLEFEHVEPWQLDAIKNLIRLKNKDHNMMWNLWESYENQL
jgi:hypothetical protein